MKKILLLIGGILLSDLFYSQTIEGHSQNNKPAFTIGITDSIKSSVLHETRKLNIYFPDDYSTDHDSVYPVIYLLDGSANEDFIHVCGIVQFLTMIGYMPPSIVVGIANIDRRRDFTFPTNNVQDKKDYPTTGGSAAFISFLANELEPYIEANYSADTNKTIIGQSLGGLLATEILLKQPELFSNYIIVSPSLWWDDESLLLHAKNLIKQGQHTKGRIIIAVGNEEKEMVDDAKILQTILNSSGNDLLSVEFLPMPAEDHLTILHNAVYQAFLHLYPHTK